MRIRITFDVRTTTPRRQHTPRAEHKPSTVETPHPADTDPTDSPTPFGFSLDGVCLTSDTDRADPYDDGRDAEYEDDDHGDQQQ